MFTKHKLPLAVLLAVSGSGVTDDVALTVLVCDVVVPAGTVYEMLKVVVPPEGNVVIEHAKLLPVVVEQPTGRAPTRVNPAGHVSVTVMLFAFEGPRFVTTIA